MKKLIEALKPWISIINCVLIVAGVLGFWRDRIVVNETKLETTNVTLGEIKGQLSTVIGAQGTTNTSIELLKQDITTVKASQDRLEKAQDDLRQDQLDLNTRVGVLEQRRSR